jgi:hypothetical protein
MERERVIAGDSFSKIAPPVRGSGLVDARAMAGPAPRVARAFAALALVVVMALCGCWQRDKRFDSTATYRAPRNNLLVEGKARGIVPAGWDHSRDYRGRFRLRREDDPAASIELLLSSEYPRKCRVAGRHRILQWSFTTYAASLETALEEAGIEVPAPDELEEVAHVMSGLVAGPKGTVMKGQTDVLEVVEVQLDYLD